MSKINNWAKSFSDNTVAYGTGTQAEYFAAIGAKATAGKWYTTHSGVWVSAGAGYGPQVEFESAAARDAFVKANDGAFASTGTTAPRVNVNSVAMFVAAFKAAKGEVVVKETQAQAPKATAPAALIDVSLALALEEVEEEEKAISPRDAAIASIKAARPDRAGDEAFIAKVLSRMGL